MVGRLAVVCLLEAAIVAMLAWQLVAGPSPADRAAPRAGTVPDRKVPARSGAPPEVVKPRTETVSRSRREVAPKWNADDPAGVLLTGTLRLRDGRPVAASIGATLGKDRRYASAAKDGSYALLGLHPGPWQVTVRDQAIVQVEETVTITDDAVQRRDFTLEASFPVRVMIVTLDGKDATRAVRLAMSGWSDFTVVGQRDRFPNRFAATDYGRIWAGDARWSREMNPVDGFAGTLHLASVPAHVALLQRHIVLDQQVVQPAQKEVKFTVDIEQLKALGATVTVRVLDAVSGKPVTDARVGLYTSNSGGMGNNVDEQGRAVVTGLSPGLLRCTISSTEHESFLQVVRVEPRERLDLGDVRLGPKEPLTGTVLGPDGKPAGASMEWTELKWRTRPAPFSHNRTANCDAEGKFELWGTGRGAIAVRAWGKGGLTAAGVFDNPPSSPIVMRLAKPGECTVTRPRDPTRAFTVTFYDASKRATESLAITPRTTKLTMKLPFGDYTFDVHDGRDHVVQSGSLHFGETPCTLEIR